MSANTRLTVISPTLTQAHQTFEQSVKGLASSAPNPKIVFLEKKLGIPTSSACLDCADGEVNEN